MVLKNDIYEKLYDTADNNMKKHSGDDIGNKKVFLFYCQNDPGQINILDFLNIDASNEEFVQLAFLAFLNRPIDDKTFLKWSEDFNLPQETFRKKVIKRVTCSDEAANTSKKFYDNIYSDFGETENVFLAQPGMIIRTAAKVYRKMPESVKNIVRKARGIK